MVALLGVVGVAMLLTEDRYVVEPPATESVTADPGAAAAALGRFAETLETGDADAAAALAPEGAARDLLSALADNARRLRVHDVSLRYVDQVGTVAPDGSWTARADLTWALSGFDTEPARAEVEVGLLDGEGALPSLTGFTGGRVPLWLRGPVRVDRGDSALVVTVDRDPRTYAELAWRAVPQVRAVLPGARFGLVVEVPSGSQQLESVLGVPEGTYQGVAAVTASVDGRRSSSSPVHVFVNPEQLDRLRRTGAQVVMTHEAVHAATGAPSSRAPVWLVEGFADYVALRDVDLPLSRTAAQIIERVRRTGPPDRLPDERDFDLAGPHLGAAYEAAWLACRALADLVGERQLVELYDATSRGADVEVALRRAGTGSAELRAAWQDLLLEAARRR